MVRRLVVHEGGASSFSATDTAYLRCDDYHESSDTPEKLDYPQFAEVVSGLSATIREVAGGWGVGPLSAQTTFSSSRTSVTMRLATVVK